MSIGVLPKDVLGIIFGNFKEDPLMLVVFRLVCKAWSKMISKISMSEADTIRHVYGLYEKKHEKLFVYLVGYPMYILGDVDNIIIHASVDKDEAFKEFCKTALYLELVFLKIHRERQYRFQKEMNGMYITLVKDMKLF